MLARTRESCTGPLGVTISEAFCPGVSTNSLPSVTSSVVDCADFQDLVRRFPERVIPAEWGEKAHDSRTALYQVDINVQASDRQGLLRDIPEDWLRKNLEKFLSEEEKAMIEAMGGLEALMERFKQLMEEQHERHEGGNMWIARACTPPFAPEARPCPAESAAEATPSGATTHTGPGWRERASRSPSKGAPA